MTFLAIIIASLHVGCATYSEVNDSTFIGFEQTHPAAGDLIYEIVLPSVRDTELPTEDYTPNVEGMDLPTYPVASDYFVPLFFNTTIRIHDDMPLFTFYRKIGDYLVNWSTVAREVSIVIIDEDGYVVQEISDLVQGAVIRGFVDHPLVGVVDVWHDIFQIRFDDFNFNGYLDMYMRRLAWSSGRWNPHYYWLWNPEIAQFVRHEQLGEITEFASVYVNHETHQLELRKRYSFYEYTVLYYEYLDGKFIRVAEMRFNSGETNE